MAGSVNDIKKYTVKEHVILYLKVEKLKWDEYYVSGCGPATYETY